MRILHVSPSLEVAGAERILVDLARHARSHGHQVAVAAPTGPLRDELVPFGIPCHDLPTRGRSARAAAGAVLTVARVLRRFRPTVIHAHNPKMTAVTIVARRAARAGNVPILGTFHGGDARDDRAAALILRRADRLVCVEDELLTRMSSFGLPTARAHVIVNGVAPALDPEDPALKAVDDELDVSGPIIAIVGSLVESKAVDRFVRAAGIVAETLPQATFLVVGDGSERAALEALAATIGLGSRIRFLGVRRDATAIIQRATVVVSTSRGEGLSLVALETLAAGRPLIAPDVGGMRRLLGSGAGTILQDTEPSTVAAAIIDVLRMSDRGKSMGCRGLELVASHHDRRNMCAHYMAIWADLSR